MDIFDDILKQASSNTKNASKEIKEIDEARRKTKKCMSIRLAAERKQSKIVKPPLEKPKVLHLIRYLAIHFSVFVFFTLPFTGDKVR